MSDFKIFNTDDLIIWIKLLDIPEKEMIIKCIIDNKLTGLDINEITINLAKIIFVGVQEDSINILLKKRDELLKSKLIPDSPPVSPKSECIICMEEYSDDVIPRFLKCGHSFCEICLKEILKSEKIKNGGKKINCPKCKEECRILNGDFKNIPINYDLKN